MKKIHFITPTQLSFIDLITMGDSCKREDSSTIGQFGSGLKYAIALLLRNNVKFSVCVTGYADVGGRDRNYLELFKPYTYVEEDELSGKSKELIGFEVEREFESFNSLHYEDIFDYKIEQNYETGFALQLGYNWELWMALREIYSNMLDEGGQVYDEDAPELSLGSKGTNITLEFEEGSEFDNIWKNRHNFINTKEWDYNVSSNVQMSHNTEDCNWLKIFKNNILVFEDREVVSEFFFNVQNTEIDERRIASNIWNIKNSISSAIYRSTNKDLIEKLLLGVDEINKDDFLNSLYSCSLSTLSDVFFEVLDSIEGECFYTYEFIEPALKKDDRYNRKGKVIESLRGQVFNYNTVVSVKEVPKITEVVKTQTESISEAYNLDLSNISIKESPLSSSRSCVADRANNTLIISDTFDISKDMPEFVVEYYLLVQDKDANIMKTMSTELARLLKR